MAMHLSLCQGIPVRIDSTVRFASSRLVLHRQLQCRKPASFRLSLARASASTSTSAPSMAEKMSNLNELERKDYESFMPPPYTCPFALKINPLWIKEDYINWSRDWLRSLDCAKYFTPEMFEDIVQADIPAYCARVQGYPGEWGLKWHMKYTIWLLVFDEVVDVLDDGKDPIKVLSEIVDLNLAMLWSFPNDAPLLEGLVAIIKAMDVPFDFGRQMKQIEEVLSRARSQPGTVYPEKTSVPVNVFRDAWDEGIAKAPPESMLRVGYATQIWLSGLFEESKHRRTLTQPESVDAYIKLRRAASATDSILISTDLINGHCAPVEWLNSAPMARMIDAAADFFGWQNDLWSFKKEVLIQKDLFNIVRSISYHQNLPYQEAAEVATKMMHKRSKDLDEAAAELERITPPELQELFQLYYASARGICSGSCEWHTWSPRYRQSGHGE